jgi:hypothetical protein
VGKAPSETYNALNVSDVSIVVHMSGEMGNQLQHLAHAHALQYWAKNDYGINVNIMIHHQERRRGGKKNPKAMEGRILLLKCFPMLKDMDNGTGNTPEYKRRQTQQNEWSLVNSTVLDLVNTAKNKDAFDTALDHFAFLAKSERKPDTEANSKIMLPIYDFTALSERVAVNELYDVIRTLFAFNDTACCKEIPADDQTSVLVRTDKY